MSGNANKSSKLYLTSKIVLNSIKNIKIITSVKEILYTYMYVTISRLLYYYDSSARKKRGYESRHEKTCFMLYANNTPADEPAHMRSLFSIIVVRCLDSIILILAKSNISRLSQASVAEQVSLSLNWSDTLKTGFS